MQVKHNYKPVSQCRWNQNDALKEKKIKVGPPKTSGCLLQLEERTSNKSREVNPTWSWQKWLKVYRNTFPTAPSTIFKPLVLQFSSPLVSTSTYTSLQSGMQPVSKEPPATMPVNQLSTLNAWVHYTMQNYAGQPALIFSGSLLFNLFSRTEKG